jgi:rRNA maturation protein Nop10
MALAAAPNRFAYEQTRPSDAPIQSQLQHHHHQQQQQLSNHQQQSDAKHSAYLEDDDTAAILDANILDADIMQSPTHQNISFRKDSFAQSSGVLSPTDGHNWEHHYPNGLPIDNSMNGFSGNFNNDINGYGRHHSISHPPSHQHGGVWSLASDTDHCTTAGGIDAVPHPPTFDHAPYMHQRADSAHANFSHPPPPPPFNATTADAGFVPAPQVQTPMSPHSHQDWMAIAQQEMEGRPGPRQMRPNSPLRTMVDLQRRDGIRKKNGRIDIPQELNIHTIDQLIEATKDEDMLKELKQQKRLLRDLETKKKGYAHQVTMLEQQLAELNIERDNLARDRQILVHHPDDASVATAPRHPSGYAMVPLCSATHAVCTTQN